MIGIIIDLLLLLVLAFCIWQGQRKGLIMTALGVLILVLGLWAGSGMGNALTGAMSENVTPLLDWVADDAYSAAVKEYGKQPDASKHDEVAEISKLAFAELGILGGVTDRLTEKVWDAMQGGEAKLSPRAAISIVFIETFSWVIIFLFGFIIVALLLTLLLHFVSMLVPIPKVPKLDKWGGLALGVFHGLIILFVIGWILRFLGIIIPQEWVNSTLILRLLVNVNPFGAILF